MNHKEFADRFIQAEREAWIKGNLTLAETLEDPNVVYHFSSRDRVGWEAKKQAILKAPQLLPNLRIEGKCLTGDGNLVALSTKWRYTAKSEIPGFPGSIGKEVTSDGLLLLRLQNGKIVEVWETTSITAVSDP